MHADLKPYRRMKDSGVEELVGQVPSHWHVRRLGQIGAILKGHGGSKEDEVDEGVACVRYGDLYTTHDHAIVESRSFVSSAKAGDYMPIRFGDVLFAASGETIDEIGKSAVNLMQTKACCGGDVIIFRPREPLEPRFMGYAADSRVATLQKARLGRGFTVVHIYPHQIKRIVLGIPPLSEQATIVEFLDRATSQIERYIRAKEKLIALLDEQKHAVVHQAVTGQVDIRTGRAYPAYEDSGVHYLRKVPQQWRTIRLGRLSLARCDGPFGSGLKSSHYADGGVRVVRLQNIGSGNFNGEDAVYITPAHRATLGDHTVQPRDVLIAGLGDPRNPAGRACVAPANIAPAMVKADCFRFRMDEAAIHPEFAALQLTATAFAASALLSSGATRQRINLESTARRLVGLPPLSEQARLVEYCHARAARLDDGQGGCAT